MQTPAVHSVNKSFPGNIMKVLLSLFVLYLSVGSTAACESTKELTRAKAQSLIEESAEFKQPAIISLKTRYENQAEALSVDKLSSSEKAQEAEQRVRKLFLEYFPQIGVAEYLGLTTIETAFVKEEKGVFQVPAQWYFTVKARANERGRAAWKEYGMPLDDEAIPIAKKQFGAITGMTKLAENQAKADFNWKWIPNSVGQALDEQTAEFKALPVEVQNPLLGKSANNLHAQVEDWSGERTASGLYQHYDDGWRLSRFW